MRTRAAGDREAEQAVEEDRVLDVAGEREALALQLHRLAERGQVAAQLLQRVHPVRAALADHERVEGQVAAHVGAVVDQVPDDVGVARRARASEQAGGVGRQVEPQELGGRAADAAEALRLAVAEDPAEVARRALGDGERLREEHRALGVVARGVVDERDRDELRVVVAGALQLGDPLGPRDAHDQRLEARVARGVLLVHREHDQVLDPVAAVALGAERLQVERMKSGFAKPPSTQARRSARSAST